MFEWMNLYDFEFDLKKNLLKIRKEVLKYLNSIIVMNKTVEEFVKVQLEEILHKERTFIWEAENMKLRYFKKSMDYGTAICIFSI